MPMISCKLVWKQASERNTIPGLSFTIERISGLLTLLGNKGSLGAKENFVLLCELINGPE